MADITGGISRYETDDTRQFTLVTCATVPVTVSYIVYNTDGSTLAPASVQTSYAVATSASGLFYIFRVLPSSVGFYTGEWRAFDAASRTYIKREQFEVIKTSPVSFWTYGAKADVLRAGRQLIGRGDLTEADIQPRMQAADGYINGKLGLVTTVPVTPTPSLVQDMSLTFALRNLYLDFGSPQKDEPPPAVIKRADIYDQYLNDIIEGKAALEVQSGTIVQLSQEILSFTGGIDSGKPTFGRRDFESQEIDSDIIDFEDES